VSDQLLVEDSGDGVRTLTLNRPEKLNALSLSLADDLVAALSAAEVAGDIRCLVIRGAGPAFCAGADLSEHFGPGSADIGRHELWDRLEASPLPVVAAVHGWAITGGFLLAYCCDIVIASEDARFRDTHAALALIPTGGESQRMPRRLGHFRAKELMLTSRPFTAQEAERAGLVARVVERESLDDVAMDYAQTIASHSPRSIAAIKRLINLGSGLDLASGIRLEAVENRFGEANREPDADREAALVRFKG
jgi:enoyl-CoA hydratase/carnithine racemase